jgi:A/G-specific adenine glycosylase
VLYNVLVAEVLLQHTPSARVVPVFTRLVGRWPSFRALAGASGRDLERLLRPLGLQRRRAGALIAIAKTVVGEWSDKVPADDASLLALPGVGTYTAGVTIAVARKRPAKFVDGGLARLYRRYFGLAPGPVRDPQLESLTQRLLTGGDTRLMAWGLLDLSRVMCRPRPRCGVCPLSRLCTHANLAPHMV